MKPISQEQAYRNLAAAVLEKAVDDLKHGKLSTRLEAAVWIVEEAPTWTDALNMDMRPQDLLLHGRCLPKGKRRHNE